MSEIKFYEYSNSKNPKHLVIFLHGYGANGENLLDLAHEFKEVLPEGHFISPNAIQPWEGGFPHSYQWFSLNNGMDRRNIGAMAQDIKNSNRILQKFINDQLARFELEPKNLFLVGFSQGAMMAIYQGLIEATTPAGVIAFSGKLVLPEMLGEKTSVRPEICLIHGQADSVVPFENFLESKKILEAHNISFEAHALKHLDHSIDSRGILAAQNFIRKIIS